MVASNTPKKESATVTQNNIEMRVGRLEGAVESLASEVKETNLTVKELAQHVIGFQKDVNASIQAATTPKWPLIVSIASLVITIVVMGATLVAFLFSGQQANISDNRAAISELRNTEYDAQYLRGQFSAWQSQVDSKFSQLSDELHAHQEKCGTAHVDCMTELTRLADRAEDLHLEVEKLHHFSDKNLEMDAEKAAALAALQTRVDGLVDLLDALSTDRFYGKEGEELRDRVQELERFLRGPPKTP